ncbi:glycerophosphoryl diester phosphodiesterase [Alkalihalobacillus alcalophilus ATCC 27647 = CGMCC 1.3604]|uniref:Glycerophosphoryl diester phosphodiesterase n=1 Tax=Alkalihalobacillus alcalophilus ATCC 27647 = CGMCC 1.3604 TaxID=1218173 RepID=A0A4V3X8K1_ALKAL|nr:glycerophosphoryl diester phosphodiesterase [Alkalihalobacillus alcalophilus ATCC 27647 = CGMCC 1.3604]
MKWKSVMKGIGLFLILLMAFMIVNNSSFFTKARDTEPYLLAHRGLGQTFSMEGIEGDTCTAERIFPPEHVYLENTLRSMEAAFATGADAVEFDIRPTKDGQFAVFHDWTLDCRTDVQGLPSDYTMAELKNVDIGYGYTADQGETYPFRGEGVGEMPSLDEVLSEFPEHSFLIDMKSNDFEEGKLLAKKLGALSDERLQLLTVYGGDKPIAALKEELPRLRVMSMETMKNCMIPYMAAGWTGYIPKACEHTQIHLPEKFAPLIWGWPDKFLNRMDSVDTRVIVVAGDGGWSEGFDEVNDLSRLPNNFSGGIWTNRIDRVGPWLKGEETE